MRPRQPTLLRRRPGERLETGPGGRRIGFEPRPLLQVLLPRERDDHRVAVDGERRDKGRARARAAAYAKAKGRV